MLFCLVEPDVFQMPQPHKHFYVVGQFTKNILGNMSLKINTTGFRIREATIKDVSALAALHVETFNETHAIHPNAPSVELREYQWQKAFQEKDDS